MSSVFRDPWRFFEQVLRWEARHVAGSPGGPPIPDDLTIRLPEHDTALSPTWAVQELGGATPWQLLVRIEAPGVDPDARARGLVVQAVLPARGETRA